MESGGLQVESKMNLRLIVATVVCLAAATSVVPGVALAQMGGGEDINLGEQIVDGTSSVSNTVTNEADMYLNGVSGSASAANCQWDVGYQVNAISLVSVDGFGLIDDSDELEADIEFGRGIIRDLGISAEDDVELDTVTSEAYCDQTLGTIRIVDDRANGWGEAAPSGDALGAVAGTLGAWPGSSSANIAIQIVGGSSYVDDTVVNRVYMDLSDTSGVAAAANCQWVVGVDVVATSIAKVEGALKLVDKDESEVELDLGTLPNGPVASSSIEAEDDVEDDSEYATASCTQHVDLIEFLLGGVEYLPPQS